MRLKDSSKRRFVGPVACVVALGFLGFSVVYPQINSAYAVDGSGSGNVQVQVNNTPPASEQRDSTEGIVTVDVNTRDTSDISIVPISDTITVTVEEYLQITIPNAESGGTADVLMEADPVTDGVTTKNSANFTVAGNNHSGFGVFVYAATDPNLSGTEGNLEKVAPIAASNTPLSNFAVNSWGYNVTLANAADATVDAAYNPLTTRSTATAAYTVSGPSAGENLKLNCGAKVDTNIPADTYSTGVVISAVAPATNWGN